MHLLKLSNSADACEILSSVCIKKFTWIILPFNSDINKDKSGGIHWFLAVIYVGSKSLQSYYVDSISQTQSNIDQINNIVKLFSKYLELDYADVEIIHANNGGWVRTTLYGRPHRSWAPMRIESKRGNRSIAGPIIGSRACCKVSFFGFGLIMCLNFECHYSVFNCKFFKTFKLSIAIPNIHPYSGDHVEKGGSVCPAVCSYGGGKAPFDVFVVCVVLISGTPIMLKVEAMTTILEVKEQIEFREGVPPINQLLIWCGKNLQDGMTLASYGIKKDSTLHLTLRLFGGMDEEKNLKNLIGEKKQLKRRLTMAYGEFSEDLDDRRLKTTKENYTRLFKETIKKLEEIENLAEESEDQKLLEKIRQETEKLEERDENLQEDLVKRTSKLRLSEISVDKHQISNKVSSRKLQPITIPSFNGRISEFGSWFTRFKAVIGTSDINKEEKLLHLQQYLKDEPLKMVERLGYVEGAYDTALRMLEEKYGGSERCYNSVFDDLDRLKEVRFGNQKDLSSLAELIETIKLKLTSLKKNSDFTDGLLFNRLLKKLPEKYLVEFARWKRLRNKTEEPIEKLLSWVKEEAGCLLEAREVSRGLEEYQPKMNLSDSRSNFPKKLPEGRTLFTKSDTRDSGNENKIEDKPSSVQKTFQPYLKKCLKCNNDHYTDQCGEIKKMTGEERWQWLRKENACGNCLKVGHMKKFCKRPSGCNVKDCKGKHHWLLHTNVTKSNQDADNTCTTGGSSSEVTHVTNNKFSFVSLRTIPVVVENNGNKIRINILLDDASTSSYISNEVATELKLIGVKEIKSVGVIGGNIAKLPCQSVKVHLANLKGDFRKEIQALTIKDITGNLAVIDWKNKKDDWGHLKEIPFPTMGKRKGVDMLIGSDYIELHSSLKEIKGKIGQPIARLTPLGWTCVGKLREDNDVQYQSHFVHTYFGDTSLEDQIRRFWELDEITRSETPMSTLDKRILQETREQLVKENNRFMVKIPWNELKSNLHGNQEIAKRRLESLNVRLRKDEQLRKEYSEIIEGYQKKQYIREVPENEKNETEWCLPHFPIVRRDKQTTKVRIVFDAAVKQNGKCLNDAIHCGPKLQGDLTSILIRFRKFAIAIVCDIAEMYLQIKIQPEDRKWLRFLWKEEDGCQKLFEFERLVFGLNTSPFLAQLVVKENADIFKDQFPRAVATIQKSTYMDDCLDSVKTTEEAIELCHQLIRIWEEAGMSAKKWLSNCPEVNKMFQKSDDSPQLKIKDDKDIKIKTLGIAWETLNDDFTFSVNDMESEQITKRKFLSLIAQIFDPLGLIAPIVVRAKILMQQIWISGLNWDDRIVDDLHIKLNRWIEECQDIKEIKIPRCLNPTNQSSLEIHVFVDASEEAYGAVAYARTYCDDIYFSRIIAAKSKISPIKCASIPRLELMAACVGVALAGKIVMALEQDLCKVMFWSDSLDVLWWITQPSRCFKTFIAHRVGTIQEKTGSDQWRYVPTKENPADLLSRGLKAKDCVRNVFWLQGPAFLLQDEKGWPARRIKTKTMKDEELKKNIRNEQEEEQAYFNNSERNLNRLDPSRFSNLDRLIRIRAWVQRFCSNIKEKEKENRLKGELMVSELNQVELQLIKEDQTLEYARELNCLKRNRPINNTSKILKFLPSVGEDGLIRANTRLIHAPFMSLESKVPIILSDKSWLTRLFVRREHIKGKHYAGVQHICNNLRKRFWIPKVKRLIQNEEQLCGKCRRIKAKGTMAVMGPIPKFRLEEPFRVFSKVGVDFAGPFFTKQGRGKSQLKRYACLFTCLQIRAVHLEMATGLDVDSFLLAFRRFIARRGCPEIVISDNGTNFVGAVNDINELERASYNIQKEMAKDKIQWIFNPPSAPHFGGVYESLIKSMKRAMTRILTNADVNDEELMTVLIEIEHLINERPIGICDEDSKSFSALTPNHFLLGITESNPEFTSNKDKVRHRWRRSQEFLKQLWKRWMEEVVPNWATRQKWLETKRPIEEGDIVWILDRKNDRGTWPLGKVIKIFPGSDHTSRVVQLLAEGKESLRAINRLCVIERKNDSIINEKRKDSPCLSGRT